MKHEELRRRLATDLLQAVVGERLPTVRDWATRHGASLGATQAALSQLITDGAVAIDHRGWQGAVLRERSLGTLWGAARGEALVIALPLPSFRRCEGLATGIKTLLTAAGIETFLIFLRGSRRRIQALQQLRCHVAVMSSFAATDLCGPGERCVLELPPQSYVGEHRVFFTDREQSRGRPLRVVMDHESADLERLTYLEFGEAEMEYVPASYMQFTRLMSEDKADAAVWDVDETLGRLPPEVRSRPLSERVRKQIGDKNTQAAFIGRHADDAVAVVIAECLRDPQLLDIQSEVFAGTRVPEY